MALLLPQVLLLLPQVVLLPAPAQQEEETRKKLKKLKKLKKKLVCPGPRAHNFRRQCLPGAATTA